MVYIALAITATLSIGLALWGLHEAKKYRAYRDEQLASAATKRRHWASSAKMKGVDRAFR
jgi:choline-glycine betaine transporter